MASPLHKFVAGSSQPRTRGASIPRAQDVIINPQFAKRSEAQKRARSPQRSQRMLKPSTQAPRATKSSRLEGQQSIETFFHGPSERPPSQMLARAGMIPSDKPLSKDSGNILTCAFEHCSTIQKLVKSRKVLLRGSPWVPWSHAQAVLKDVLQLSTVLAHLDMQVFAWAPEELLPGFQIKCPSCKLPVTSSEWSRPRILHGLSQISVYTSRLYTCYGCQAGKTPRKKFSADLPEVLAQLPHQLASQRMLLDTGRTLFEAPVLDLVRSLAIRTSCSHRRSAE